MKFANINYFYAMWIVLLLALFYYYAYKKHLNLLALWGDLPLVKKLTNKINFGKRKLKAVIFLLAAILIVIAFAQPQWGYHWEELKRSGIDIMIVLDTSKSMLADDIKPNRFTAAKLEIEDLLKILDGDRIGLVAFAGTSFLQCPLTLDYGAMKLFLDNVDTDILPQQGTDIGSAVVKALSTFERESKKHRAIILISDGEDHNSSLKSAGEEAKKQGVPVYAIGMGTKDGAPIPLQDDSGNKAYLKDRNGNIVLSKLDDSTLKEISFNTGGAYADTGSGASGLEKIYTDRISKIEKMDLESATKKIYENRFQWPLAIALILLIIEGLISDRRK